ncbi:MAG: hypothetical protein JOS17DRAFT_379464 [Linnemannia elongata]|nr:MAG: hypothetical protein JOS17DRAFT_379464 [Linnemannia elongata]
MKRKARERKIERAKQRQTCTRISFSFFLLVFLSSPFCIYTFHVMATPKVSLTNKHLLSLPSLLSSHSLTHEILFPFLFFVLLRTYTHHWPAQPQQQRLHT